MYRWTYTDLHTYVYIDDGTLAMMWGSPHTLGERDEDHIGVAITRALGGANWGPLYKGHEDHIGVNITKAMAAPIGPPALHGF